MFQRVPTATSINLITSASIAKLAVLYRKVLKKFKFSNNHLWFNNKCLSEKVFPNYIQIKTKNQCYAAKKALHQAKIYWLKEEIKKWYSIRYNLNLHLKLIHCKLVQSLHPFVFDEIDRDIRELVQTQSHKQYIVQRNKLKNLVKNSYKVDPTSLEEKSVFFTRVQNNSTTSFTKEEFQLLNKGLHYAPNLPIEKTDLENLALDCEIALTDFSNPNQNSMCKTVCANLITKNSKHKNNNLVDKQIESKIIQKLKTKLKVNNLILSKADKGNTITIMEKSNYISKVDDFINANNITQLPKDPTNKFQLEIKQTVKQSTLLFDISKQYSLISPNPSAPILYGLLKLHKKDQPIRPVCSYIHAPATKLCKALIPSISKYLQFNPLYTIRNSLDLVNKINNENSASEGKLVSFDVSNLFTSIPINDLKKIIYEKTSYLNPILQFEINSLLSTCINQNYFTFNGKFYQQLEGLPMGSPLSPLLADIYMDWFENMFFKQNNSLIQKIGWWYRYVDDVLCFWKGTDRQLVLFLNFLNSLNKNIQFTLETESNKCINFLDLTITRINNKFSYGIYRKPTYTDTIIPISSNHSKNTKYATFHNLVHRLIHIPLSTAEFNKELNTIYQIAINNGYSKDLVNNILYKKRKKFFENQIYTTDKSSKISKNYRKLQFIPKLSFKISKELNYNNITPAFYSKKTLGNFLTNNKIVNKDKLDNSGVYEIKCNNCDFIYIGKTTRSFKIRFKEHLRAFNLKRPDNSNIAKHLLTNNHTISSQNLKILHIENKGLKLNFLEALEIQKAVNSKKNLMNEQIDLFSSPLIKPF